jgi:hypothetical protein
VLSALAAIFLFAQVFAAPTSQEAALEFVTKQRLGTNLSTIALATASRTQTYSMLTSKLGVEQARAVVQREVDALLPRYQPTWNQNLATAYAKHFSTEELQSLAEDGRSSKFAGKVKERQSAVGNDVRAASEPVLKALVTEAMKNAFEKSAK